jgi:hypothetical protein
MNTIPPNNLEQLVAWIRVFAEEANTQIQGLQKTFQEFKETLEKEKQ